ncbi:hypothetical protein AGR7A_Lc20059 [Agrobacterium deltaense NCPPB 1641]|uniref:Propionyl-coenzyme A carboxylase alpha polypeptide n=1 Tax=Agrobacterium deltaense NCPPB 1641 TaxID=1183425 RepID=A0A1S7U4D8_9HYPH|nr:hypothetical protein AGR7A_Lc20059 [Agrobacterium deltaense NCPPB 1641]
MFVAITLCARGLPPSALPGISPSRGEIDKRRAPCPWNERVRHLISPLEGEMPGRAEGGKPQAKGYIQYAGVTAST